MGTFRCCWGSMGLLLRPFRVYGSISLIEWALLGGLWALLGTYELFIWTADGPFWELMGPFWELIGRFGELMGPFWELMGPFGSWWALFGSWWALLGSWWALFGSCWALFGSWRALFGISWAPLYTSSYTFYAFFILFYIHFFLQFFKNFGPRGSYPAIPALSVGLHRLALVARLCPLSIVNSFPAPIGYAQINYILFSNSHCEPSLCTELCRLIVIL